MMGEVVVTGTRTRRAKLQSTVAISTMSTSEIRQTAPRSSTELLRRIPGFTRVESSGGEVNQNISIRGILGVEYVNFMEDGSPVYPTMHTFFMNADNLFRPDENIERVEVVRGGNSALFGSNAPGAGLRLRGSGTILDAEFTDDIRSLTGAITDTIKGNWLPVVPPLLLDLSGSYSWRQRMRNWDNSTGRLSLRDRRINC